MIIETKYGVGDEVYFARHIASEKTVTINGPWTIRKITLRESSYNGEKWSSTPFMYDLEGTSYLRDETSLYSTYKEAEAAMRKLMNN